MVGPPPPPAPPSAIGAATRDFLNVELDNVYVGQLGQTPLSSYAPARPPRPDGRTLLHAPTTQNPLPVSFAIAQRLLSALASLVNANNEARTFANSITIREFRNLTQLQQMAHIDGIWNRCTTAHRFGQYAAGMFEPADAAIAGIDPLPSSICPDGAGGFHKRLAAGAQPFQKLGVGFRTEGSTARALRDGFIQQRLNSNFMKGPHRGLNIEGTVLMTRKDTARFWSGNHDIFNESAICVSRNFFGGTAFPLRQTNARCFLFAIDCSNLKGFDTERHQLNQSGSRHWRPGEKAYPGVPVGNILGYLEIDRRGAPPGGGWRFDIGAGAAWVYTGNPSVAQRVYLEDELAAWRGNHVIPPEFDFAIA